MLYGYTFTLPQMSQIKNWKKEHSFDHILQKVKELQFSTMTIEGKVYYQKTVPLNMFEKYAIRLIERAEEQYASIDMNVSNIAKLLHLDHKLVKDNLQNLESIGMLNGIESDVITINRDEYAEYLQYENKFKEESIVKKYELTSFEYEDMDAYIRSVFERDDTNKDKRYRSYDIESRTESVKKTSLLQYANDKFLLFGKDGVNSNNDLKFMNTDANVYCDQTENIPDNTVCHYEECLPILRDMLAMNRDDIVVIGSRGVEQDSLDILKAAKNVNDVYIISSSDFKHNRVFDVGIKDDFIWIGDSFYMKEGDFVIQKKNLELHQIVKEHLTQYFLNKIIEIEPDYSVDELKRLSSLIETAKGQFKTFEYKTRRDIDEEVKRVNTEKNKLYGLAGKNSQQRKKVFNIIEKLEKDNKQKELEQYPEYIKNRKEILAHKERVVSLQQQRESIEQLDNKINELNRQKSLLVSKENKSRIALIEKELKNIERLKI